NIVQIYEVGDQDGLPYFSLELCEGGTLAAKLTRTPLPPEQAARLVQTLARAMHYAHQHGILHRDLKPANGLLAVDRQPKITDVGLAKRIEGDSNLTQTGVIVGTPSYMPPEQAGGKKGLTTAVDVYSLGAILYELLTGRPPFRAETQLDTLLHVLEKEPEPPRRLNPSVDRDLGRIALVCLDKDPVPQYPSPATLAANPEL